MNDNDDPVWVNSRITESTPPPLDSYRDDIPPEGIRLIESLLEKEPGGRPQSGWEICQRLEKIGAQYPYKRAFRGKYLIDSALDPAANIDKLFPYDHKYTPLLRDYSEGSNINLRLLLTANQCKNNLDYNGYGFQFINHVYWPKLLRRQILKVYQTSGFTARKQLVTTAILGDWDTGNKLGCDNSRIPKTGQPVLTLLRQFIKPTLIKRLSSKFAPIAERDEYYLAAARLYLQAGDFGGCERCTHQWQHRDMINTNNNNSHRLSPV